MLKPNKPKMQGYADQLSWQEQNDVVLTTYMKAMGDGIDICTGCGKGKTKGEKQQNKFGWLRTA